MQWCIHVLVVLMSWGVVEGGCGRVARGPTRKGENFLTQGFLSKLSTMELDTRLLCLCNAYTDNYEIQISIQITHEK